MYSANGVARVDTLEQGWDFGDPKYCGERCRYVFFLASHIYALINYSTNKKKFVVAISVSKPSYMRIKLNANMKTGRKQSSFLLSLSFDYMCAHFCTRLFLLARFWLESHKFIYVILWHALTTLLGTLSYFFPNKFEILFGLNKEFLLRVMQQKLL